MKTRWYKNAVIYQIYPRSFCDDNGDGIGDLKGITSKIDYIKSLGVDCVWLSPCFKSPNDDNGYDISDYVSIMDEFGTMQDFDEMLEKFHQNGIRVMLDLVVNHTSDEHSWFQESKKSSNNPYSDYYIWQKGKGKDGKKPPNNWVSRFFGSAWEYCKERDAFYLHLFGKGQPDLNCDNPKVREEISAVCNFWLEKGVDGFRCDVIPYISKKEGYPNSKMFSVMKGDDCFVIGPNWKKYIREVGDASWNKFDTFMLGEGIGLNSDTICDTIKEESLLMDSAIQFEAMECDVKLHIFPKKLDLKKMKGVYKRWSNNPNDCWNTWYYENHDQPRCVSRFGDDKNFWEKSAKMLCASYFFQKGVLLVYQGQEIGMTNCDFEQDEYNDIMYLNIGASIKKMLPFMSRKIDKMVSAKCRDNARTPMQWNDEVGAGFSNGKTWLKINPNYTTINVEKQEKENNSILSFYKQLIAIRKKYIDVLSNGSYVDLCYNNKKIYSYMREHEGRKIIVVCNFSDSSVLFKKSNIVVFSKCEMLASNYDDAISDYKDCTLKPFETKVFLLS